jgi:hypothetical protein
MGDLSLSDIKSGGIRVQILTEQPKVNCGLGPQFEVDCFPPQAIFFRFVPTPESSRKHP